MLANNLLLILATWRLTSLLSNTNEHGPYELLDKVRYLAGVRYDSNSQPYGTNELSKGLVCFWCCSVWVGAALALLDGLLRGAAPIWYLLVAGLAYSAGAIVLEGIAGTLWNK